ncbi:MAG: TIGR02996 domain-containing protein [Labilithrix sp.]
MSAIDPKLLGEILARPMDDAPRLVLADALQEKGDARGHFIVAQCRLTERGLPRAERQTLAREVTKLTNEHGDTWAGPAALVTSWIFRRGFVDQISGTATQVAAVAREIFATQPILRLSITDVSRASLEALDEAGAFARISHLQLSGSLGDEGARALAQMIAKSRTSPLTTLNLGGNGIGPTGTKALVAVLAGCRSLVLTDNALGDEGVQLIAGAKTLSSLEVLFLTSNELTDECLPALAKSSALGALTRLGLARNEGISSEGLATIAKSKKLRKLRWLEYSNEDGYQSIAVRGR